MLTDAQNPFLGTPLAPLKQVAPRTLRDMRAERHVLLPLLLRAAGHAGRGRGALHYIIMLYYMLLSLLLVLLLLLLLLLALLGA